MIKIVISQLLIFKIVEKSCKRKVNIPSFFGLESKWAFYDFTGYISMVEPIE